MEQLTLPFVDLEPSGKRRERFVSCQAQDAFMYASARRLASSDASRDRVLAIDRQELAAVLASSTRQAQGIEP